MAGINAYTSSLRNDRVIAKPYEEGVPFYVPLPKVKTSVMCVGKTQKLLFSYESTGYSSTPLSPKSLPYRKQGDHSLYTEENLLRRKKLMEDPNVLKAIERFWETFYCIRRGGDTIPAQDYVEVFMKFYKALVAPSEFSIGEARCIVERDWVRDSIDGESMSKVLFFGALFEVADIWTIDISAEEYASFLNKLFERVTMTIYDHVKLQWITAFAELDKIRSFDDPTPPDEDPGDQNFDCNGKPGATSDDPTPPLIRKTKSAKALLPPLNSLSSTPKDLPEPTSANRGQNDSDDGWGSSVGDEFDDNDDTSRDHLFDRGPTKTRLEQVLEDREMKSDNDLHSESSKTRSQRLALPELTPQQVLLPIPSIYLNPDLTGVHEAERAARRRLRHNVKVAQRLRRITF